MIKNKPMLIAALVILATPLSYARANSTDFMVPSEGYPNRIYLSGQDAKRFFQMGRKGETYVETRPHAIDSNLTVEDTIETSETSFSKCEHRSRVRVLDGETDVTNSFYQNLVTSMKYIFGHEVDRSRQFDRKFSADPSLELTGAFYVCEIAVDDHGYSDFLNNK